MHTDPVIHIVAATDRPSDAGAAEDYRRAQFEAWDMIAGHRLPGLGGDPRYLDVLGVNYYPYNQWEHNGPPLTPDDPRHLGGVHPRQLGHPARRGMLAEDGDRLGHRVRPVLEPLDAGLHVPPNAAGNAGFCTTVWPASGHREDRVPWLVSTAP